MPTMRTELPILRNGLLPRYKLRYISTGDVAIAAPEHHKIDYAKKPNRIRGIFHRADEQA
jgi:hypothetical protein